MKTILSLKTASGNPADGIDNFNQAVFGRMDPAGIQFWASGDIAERGAIKKIVGSRLRFLWRRGPDVLWGNGNVLELPLVLVARFLRSPARYVVNFHTMLFARNAPWAVRTPWFVRRFIFGLAHFVICPSEASAASVRKFFPKKEVSSILNGVDLALFNPAKRDEPRLREKYGIDFSQPVVAFVGSLHARKRPDLFIALAKVVPEANFVAVGRAVPEFDCLRAAKDLKNFKWIGAMPREDVASFLASSAAFVFPSLNDSSAAVILEAMASGAVPVVSASGGSGEFFRDGASGFLVPRNGAGAAAEKKTFAEKLRALLMDSDLRQGMSRAARHEAESHSWEVVAKQYEHVLCEDR